MPSLHVRLSCPRSLFPVFFLSISCLFPVYLFTYPIDTQCFMEVCYPILFVLSLEYPDVPPPLPVFHGVWYFPKGIFPSDKFPSGNFPNVQFPERKLPKGQVRPYEAPKATMGEGPSAVARTGSCYWEKSVGKSIICVLLKLWLTIGRITRKCKKILMQMYY